MMGFAWKILEVYADGEIITSVKYFCSGTDGENTVETEGYWTFKQPELVTPFADVTEDMIAKWVEDDSIFYGENIIKSRIVEQLKSLSKKPVPAPWLPQTFTPDL
jgi:hypothetical protein